LYIYSLKNPASCWIKFKFFACIANNLNLKYSKQKFLEFNIISIEDFFRCKDWIRLEAFREYFYCKEISKQTRILPPCRRLDRKDKKKFQSRNICTILNPVDRHLEIQQSHIFLSCLFIFIKYMNVDMKFVGIYRRVKNKQTEVEKYFGQSGI
jgi:hypothetical protein